MGLIVDPRHRFDASAGLQRETRDGIAATVQMGLMRDLSRVPLVDEGIGAAQQMALDLCASLSRG